MKTFSKEVIGLEQTWAERLRNNDETALTEIMTQYTAYVFSIVRNFSKGMLTISDLEEVTADVFIRLWHNRQYVQDTVLSPYLAAIARNCIKNRFRSMGKHVAIKQEWDTLQIEDGVDICHNAEQMEAFTCAVTALGQLAATEREILIRFHFYGEKTAEIAAALSLSCVTVRVKLHRGREKLRHILEERGFSYVE